MRKVIFDRLMRAELFLERMDDGQRERVIDNFREIHMAFRNWREALIEAVEMEMSRTEREMSCEFTTC